eukprot:CAMPEP_0117573360 /NCGR_PEP_ID=MMETSP0784-20121206/60910_1 /TAXON_ID=39447 /ORGANISM="" /LENGTH=219 /DNA_ID=CAMNT_0005371915 /DNA_START=42 /DNA_END=701 /DNA_ORIENTATION=-
MTAPPRQGMQMGRQHGSPVIMGQYQSVQAPPPVARAMPLAQGPAPPAPGVCPGPAPGRMQVYVAPSHYKPQSVKEAWDNYFDAFSKRDVSRVIMDYDETSHVRVFNNTDGAKAEYCGTIRIHQMFQQLFAELEDLSTFDTPVVDIDEDAGQVFIVWKCPSSGYLAATETLIFSASFKIWKQNIVITKVPRCAAALIQQAVPTPSPVPVSHEQWAAMARR